MASSTQWTWVWANSGSWWKIGKLAGCSSWGCKELDMTEWLNSKKLWVLCLVHSRRELDSIRFFFFHLIIVQKLCKPDSVSSSEYLFKLYQIFNSHVRKKVLTMIKYLLNVIYQTLSQNGKFKIWTQVLPSVAQMNWNLRKII